MKDMVKSIRLGALITVMAGVSLMAMADEHGRIQPYDSNPYYWQYEGEPVLLLGGSKDDNLFQLPELEAHLDEIAAAGGNYIRNTMSDRQDKGHEAYPFKRLENGKYDLEQWNDTYWQRFENMLRWTSERDIIVQIEVWDRFDYSRDNWPPHPYNPKNNVNYSYEESGFEGEYPNHPGANDQPFFFTTPEQNNNQTVLQYQQKFVNKLLDHALQYPNVLYCMDNETSGEEAWAVYWAEFIRKRAERDGKRVNLTEMWDAWNLREEEHRRTLDHPERFDFVDVSQNNHQTNETHWQNFHWVREYIADSPRPINNVKIYGADGGRHGGDDTDAIEKFWRLTFGGAASARFHRPTSGIGLSDLAKTQLQSARLFLDEFNIFTAQPDAEHTLLSNRDEDQAYLTRNPGEAYAVLFTNGGEVEVDMSGEAGEWNLRWLDVSKSEWHQGEAVEADSAVTLNAPGDGLWVALLQIANKKTGAKTGSHIQPFEDNPHYFAWDGTPVFFLGATSKHSWTPISRPGNYDIQANLARLAEVMNKIESPHVRGFVRCLPYDPMNHMHDGDVKKVLQPWVKTEDDRYDLTQFEPEWEKRLRGFLSTALQNGILVSLEIWDDWSVTRGPGGAYDPGEGAAWNAHPFNPKNNTNYDESTLPASTDLCNAPFYSTVPARQHIKTVLDLQKQYVDQVLSIASDYPNILINISNESRAHLDWSRFWAEYIRQRVSPDVMIGEMPSTNREDGGGECEQKFNPLTLCTDPLYDYVDIAQAVSGHEFNTPLRQALGGVQRIREYRQAMAKAGTIRPLVTSKDYTRTPDGGDMVLWGRFFGGVAASRFHRPAGDHPESVSQFQHDAVNRLGNFIAELPFWRMYPNQSIVKALPDGAGANCLAEPDGDCVVQLIGGEPGDRLSLNLPAGTWTVRWIDPSTGDELSRSNAVSTGELNLDIAGGPEHRVIHLKKDAQ